MVEQSFHDFHTHCHKSASTLGYQGGLSLHVQILKELSETTCQPDKALERHRTR